jgi:CRISPR/Cas system-associated protein Csx1
MEQVHGRIVLATAGFKMNKYVNVKNNSELYTKWRKTNWKTFEETIRRSRNRSIEDWLVTADDDK